MSVVHIASASQNEGTATTTCTITIPASVITKDDLYVLIQTDTAPSMTCTDDDAGGNTRTAINNIGDTCRLFWKKATSGTASKTITIGTAVGSVCGGVSVFRGAALGDPTTNITSQANGSGAESHAAFTPTKGNSMICFAVYNSFAATVTSLNCTNPGTLEPELFNATSTGGGDSNVIFSARPQVGGTFTTGSLTWSQVNNPTKSLAFAIQPAASSSFLQLF